MFSISKVKSSQKFIWGLPDRICRLNQNHKKLPESTNKKEKKIKSRMFSTSKVKKSREIVWGRNFQG
jgi:hypothetical protein